MHEMGCMRQNYKCKTCGACVAKADKEDHEEKEHEMLACENCEFKEMKVRFMGHDQVCENKPQNCKICKTQVKPNEMYDHLQQCGARTTLCNKCGEYVKLLEVDYHVKEGLCEVIRQSKQEIKPKEGQSELEKFQQARLKEINADRPENPLQYNEEAKMSIVKQPVVAPQVNN